jgi:hypothetical protein
MPLHPTKDVTKRPQVPSGALPPLPSPVSGNIVPPTAHIPPDPAIIQANKQRQRFRAKDLEQRPLDQLVKPGEESLHPARKFLADYQAVELDETANLGKLSTILRRAFEAHGIEGVHAVATYLQERSKRVANVVGKIVARLEAHAHVIAAEKEADAKREAEEKPEKRNGAA